MNTTKELREKIGEILVKWHMPTRQAAIGEIITLLTQEKAALLNEVGRRLPPDDVITTKYGYYRDEKKYGYRIAMVEVRSTLKDIKEEL